MLTRSNQVAPQQEYYDDSLLKLPSESDTIFHNLAQGIATPIVALNMMNDDFSKKPEGRAILDSFNATELENQTPGMGWSQWLSGQGANMLGMALNPVNWVTGEAGGAVAEGISAGVGAALPDAASVFLRKPLKDLLGERVGSYIPAMIGKEGAEKPLSVAVMAENTFKNFGIGAGSMIPTAIVDNYNQDTNHIAWGGVARESANMGAFGMAISSIPFAWGILRGKVNRGLDAEPSEEVGMDKLNQALSAGHITPEEHQWYSDYLEHLKNPSDTEKTAELQQRATDIINKNGQYANTVTNEAKFDILSPDDVKNLHGVIADQLASADMPEEQRTALSDFIINSKLDQFKDDPKSLDGLRGYVDFINQKLNAKSSKLAEADQILDDYLLKGVKENMPFSQKEIFKYMKQSGFEVSHMNQLPLTIPDNIKSHMKFAEKIKKLKNKLQLARRKGFPENKQTLKRIQELEAKQPKVLPPKDELLQLKEKLLSSRGLPKNWETSAAYHRLTDLSHVWQSARILLDRVHLEHEYNKQESFRDLTSAILKIADSDTTNLASPENVMDYLKTRIEGTLSKVESMTDINKAVDASQKIPTDSDTILNEQKENLKSINAEDAKKDFDQSSAKYKEFKDSENIFKNLILCVKGSSANG